MDHNIGADAQFWTEDEMEQDGETPFHVLMLPPGTPYKIEDDHADESVSSESYNGVIDNDADNDDASEEDCIQNDGLDEEKESRGDSIDYIDRRRQHHLRQNIRKKIPSRKYHDVADFENLNEPKEIEAPSRHHDISIEMEGSIKTGIWMGATPLEVSIINCCYEFSLGDNENSDDDITSDTQTKTRQRSFRCSCRNGFESLGIDGQTQGGAVRRGKEAKFVSLMARKCHSLSNRALVLAILQRTIDFDSQQLAFDKKIETKAIDEEKEQHSSQSEAKGISSEKRKNNIELTTREKSHFHFVKCPQCNESSITTNIMSLGGLKVLKDWLVEASTPVETFQQNLVGSAHLSITKIPLNKDDNEKKITSKNLTSRDDDDIHELKHCKDVTPSLSPSPTGTLLEPLFLLLIKLPINRDLVCETRINKDIRNIKKSLDRCVEKFRVEFFRWKNLCKYDQVSRSYDTKREQFTTNKNLESNSSNKSDCVSIKSSVIAKNQIDENEYSSFLGDLQDPIDGGIGVKKVLDLVNNLMDTWKTAILANLHSKKRKIDSDKGIIPHESNSSHYFSEIIDHVKEYLDESALESSYNYELDEAIKNKEEVKNESEVKIPLHLQKVEERLKEVQFERMQASLKLKEYQRRFKDNRYTGSIIRKCLSSKDSGKKKSVTWADMSTQMGVIKNLEEIHVFDSDENRRNLQEK